MKESVGKILKKYCVLETAAMLLLSLLLLLIIRAVTTPLLIRVLGDDPYIVECGDSFEDPGAEILFGLGEAETEIRVDTSKVGTYEVVYSYLKASCSRTVNVVDTTRPVITLEGSVSISVEKGGKYVEQGYSAFDIADGDLTDLVWTESDLDLNEIGEYHISYYVSDSSGNTTRERRKVSVTGKGPMTQSMTEFDLNPFYPDVICKETPFDREKYENTVFFGDSFIGYMRDYKVGIVDNLWSRGGMTPTEIYTRDIKVGTVSTGETFFGAMDRIKPETVIILLGNQVSGYWNVDYFRSAMDEIYGYIGKRYPDTNVVIMSLCPFSIEGDRYNISSSGFSRNDRINKVNAVYCDICRKYGLKFMNVAEVLKAEDGYCRRDYMGPDYFHLSKAGFEALLEYVKSHMDW